MSYILTFTVDVSGGAHSPDWQKCDIIAKIIANCPSQAKSVKEYYKLVSPQVSYNAGHNWLGHLCKMSKKSQNNNLLLF